MRFLASILLSLSACMACAESHAYDLRMSLFVPRVYDNLTSQGYRKYQLQKIAGTVYVETDGEAEPQVTVSGLVNRTHKVDGQRVTYDVFVTDAKWHVLGNNRTGKFKAASVYLAIDAEPSYVHGAPDEPDNSLIIALSGKGTERRVSGRVAGVQGCGCRWYGHVSPTRIMWTGTVTDIAAVYGSFTLRKVY